MVREQGQVSKQNDWLPSWILSSSIRNSQLLLLRIVLRPSIPLAYGGNQSVYRPQVEAGRCVRRGPENFRRLRLSGSPRSRCQDMSPTIYLRGFEINGRSSFVSPFATRDLANSTFLLRIHRVHAMLAKKVCNSWSPGVSRSRR